MASEPASSACASLRSAADVVVINARAPEQVIAEIAQPPAVFKHGKETVLWHLPELLRPQ